MPDNPTGLQGPQPQGIFDIVKGVGGVIGKIGGVIGGLLPGGGEGEITPGQLPILPGVGGGGFWDWWDDDPEQPPPQNGRMNGTCSPTVAIGYTQRAHCPPGYVAVRPGGPGTAQTCMLKSVAIDCKLYKNPTRPPIKARDWSCLKKAASVQRKLDTVFRTANKASGRRIGRISAKR